MSEVETTAVIIQEEYGYRHWAWEFRGNREALQKWWTELATVGPFFFNPADALPLGGLTRRPVSWAGRDSPRALTRAEGSGGGSGNCCCPCGCWATCCPCAAPPPWC